MIYIHVHLQREKVANFASCIKIVIEKAASIDEGFTPPPSLQDVSAAQH